MMPQSQTINECCEQNPGTTGCAHSKGEPAASLTTTNISVRFAPISSAVLAIRRPATRVFARSAVDLRTSLALANPSTISL